MPQAIAGKALPSRPNLSYLKKLAKEQLKKLRAKVPSAKLADAQLAIAREYGFASWRKLKAHIDTLPRATASVFEGLAGKVDVFLLEATSFSTDPTTTRRAESMLAEEPGIRRANLLTCCVLADVQGTKDSLSRDPASARLTAGAQNWPPLLYLTFSKFLRASKKRETDFVRVAKLLIDNGADPNSLFVHEGFNETALYGAAGITNRPKLTKLLLNAGADPDDMGKGDGAESLYHACEHADNACLKLLLKARPRKNSVSYCLNRKLDYEDFVGAKLMLDHGADPNYGSPTGDTTLMHAIRRGRGTKIVSLLIARGADVNAKNNFGMTPLRLARRLGHKELVKVLLHHGATDEMDEREEFLAACAAGRRGSALGILKKQPDLVSNLTPDEMKILPDAAASGHLWPVRHMLDLGFDINTKGDWGGSAVHQAAWHGHLSLTKFLISRGADLQQKQEFGGDVLSTAIHGATQGREKGAQIVEAVARAMKPADWTRYLKFAEEAADPRILEAVQKAASSNGVKAARNINWKPLMDAAFHGNATAVKRLLKAGTDPNVVSSTAHRYRPLHRAIEAKKLTPRGPEHEEVVRLLLDAKADPKLRGTHGQHTALQLAAIQSPRFVPLLVERFRPLDIFHASALAAERRVAELLMKNSSLATARDVNGWQALHYASASAMFELDPQHERALTKIAAMLIESGADPMTPTDSNAKWPLRPLYFCSGMHDNAAVAEVLLKAGATPYDKESIFHAADEQHKKCLKLFEKCCDRKALAEECTRCLATQLRWGMTRGIQWLLEHGADPNWIADWGSAALHSAVENSTNDKIVKLLLKHGAKVDLKNKEAKSPLEIAEKLKRVRILPFLEEALGSSSRSASTPPAPELQYSHVGTLSPANEKGDHRRARRGRSSRTGRGAPRASAAGDRPG